MDPRHSNQQQQHQHQHQQPPHRAPSHHSPPLDGSSARDSFESLGAGRRPSDRLSRHPDHPVHSRAQSASSLPSSHELSRAMPPPNSPPPGHGQHYGPPPPRAPSLASGPPSAFPSGRELPALSSLTRSGSTGSSMSISSMLGGPPPAREPLGFPPHSGPAPAPGFAPSPRMPSASSDYPPFRRPQTPPEHQRPYEPRYSPQQPHYGTPEAQRYGTPHYHSRHPSASTEPARDRMSSGPPPPPQRPSSQPKAYMPPRPEEAYGRQPEYADRRPPFPYDDRYRERETREAGMEQQRDRERRERAYSGGEANRPMPPPYGRERDPRDPHWGRQGSDPSYRAPMGSQRPPEYPTSTGPYASQPYPAHAPQPYESPDRARAMHQQQQQQHQQQHPQQQPPQPPQQQPPQQQQAQGPPPRREEPPPPPSIAYGPGPAPFDRHRMEDPAAHQRNLLAVHDINRNKGRISPLPQAVQGAQPQQQGPAGEPSIKSEFGRMFAGIGSGVSGLGMPSPTAASAQFANAAMGKRDDDLDAGPDSNKIKNRRRKLKDEQDDDGRGTPSKAKRTKQPLPSEPMVRNKHDSPPIQDRPIPQPKPKPAPLPPRVKTIVSSSAVMESASKHPRHHLGDFIYEAGLKASRLLPNKPNHRGFSSNPEPLPWDLIQGKINCTLTVKVPQIHLSSMSREEITARGYLWGTDIYTDDSDVVAACIHSGWIKGEWSESVDAEMLDADASEGRRRKKTLAIEPVIHEGLITSTPSPMPIPEDRDLHVNVLILPRLLKYGSTTRHGITSREFGGEFGARHVVHDGLSFMIQSLRWVENGAQPQARLRGKARRERMRKAMMEVQGTLANSKSAGAGNGDIPGNWRRTEGEKNGTTVVEGDKENHDAEKDGAKAPDVKDVEMEGATTVASEHAKKTG